MQKMCSERGSNDGDASTDRQRAVVLPEVEGAGADEHEAEAHTMQRLTISTEIRPSWLQ